METAVKEGVDIGRSLEVISVPEGCGFLWVHKALVNTVFVSLVSGEYEVFFDFRHGLLTGEEGSATLI